MADNNKKDENQGGGVSPVAAAVAGAVVGAGIAVAGTMAMQDEKNRAKVKEVLVNAKDQAVGYMEKMQNEAGERSEQVEKVAASAKKSLKTGVADAKKAAGK